jgi:Predicted esterase
MKLLNNDSTRIFLGGFSQGCMVSIHVKNSLKYPLGGLITIGGFKSDYTEIKEDADFSNTLIIHGTEDETVKWDFAKKSLEPILKKDGVQVCLIEGMGHNLYSSELRKKVHDFIRERCKYNATL